jgi:hypothetical protein
MLHFFLGGNYFRQIKLSKSPSFMDDVYSSVPSKDIAVLPTYFLTKKVSLSLSVMNTKLTNTLQTLMYLLKI